MCVCAYVRVIVWLMILRCETKGSNNCVQVRDYKYDPGRARTLSFRLNYSAKKEKYKELGNFRERDSMYIIHAFRRCKGVVYRTIYIRIQG